MTPSVVWTPAAEKDLEEIFLHIGRQQLRPFAAAGVVRDIVSKAKAIAPEPLMLPIRRELGPTVRSFFVHRYVVFFRPNADGIEVLRIIHGSRDIPRVFREDRS